MKPHPTDVLALIFGLALLMAGAGFVAVELGDANVDPGWVAAGSLLTLGIVALVATLTRGRAARGAVPSPPIPPDPDADPEPEAA